MRNKIRSKGNGAYFHGARSKTDVQQVYRKLHEY